jgi:large subunit ribosomal protein L37Ae
MARRTYKVGITRKYGTRYGASLRKIIKKFEVQQHAVYLCPFCGKQSVRRLAVGIWACKSCHKQIAGGAWELATAQALAAKSTMLRLKKLREEQAAGNDQTQIQVEEAAAEKDDKSKSKKGAAAGGKKGGDTKKKGDAGAAKKGGAKQKA